MKQTLTQGRRKHFLQLKGGKRKCKTNTEGFGFGGAKTKTEMRQALAPVQEYHSYRTRSPDDSPGNNGEMFKVENK